MKNCKNCNAVMKDSDEYCYKCGSKYETEISYCPNCGIKKKHKIFTVQIVALKL